MMAGFNGLAYGVVDAGWSYEWLALIGMSALATTFAAERIAPHYDEWNDDHGDTPTNIVHAIVYEISNLNAILLIPVITFLIPGLGLWPTAWPMWAQLLLAVVLADAAFTLIHYWSHRWSVLWQLHSVHHGVGRLYGFNGLVRHPLHQSIDLAIGTAPLIIFGMPTDVAVLLGVVVSIQLLIQHANVDAKLGPFRNHLSIGRLHHLHHVNWGTEGDCNFGLFFTVWDRLLGTFNPSPSRPIRAADMGIDEVANFPKTYWQQLIFPFVYTPSPSAAANDRRNLSKTTGDAMRSR